MSPHKSSEHRNEKISIKNTKLYKSSTEVSNSQHASKNTKKIEKLHHEEIKNQLSLLVETPSNSTKNHKSEIKKNSLFKIFTNKFKKSIKDEKENDLENDSKSDLHSISLPVTGISEAKLKFPDINSEPSSFFNHSRHHKQIDSQLRNKHFDKDLHTENHKHSVVTVNDLLGAINTEGNDQYELMKHFLPADIVNRVSQLSKFSSESDINVDFMGGIHF